MKRPQSNGLFEVTGGQEKERGFCCMKLITFLSANNVQIGMNGMERIFLLCQEDARMLRNVRFMRER